MTRSRRPDTRPRWRAGCRAAIALVGVLVGVCWGHPLAAQGRTESPAPGLSRAEALEEVVADDWTRRVEGLRALLDHGQPGDEPLLAAALADHQGAVVQAAADALAALGTDEALAALDTLLADPDPARRELAALALVRHRLDLDDDRLARIELQLVSDLGRRWLAGRATMLEILALRDDAATAFAAVRNLTTRDDIDLSCLREEAVVLGIELEVIVGDEDRAARFWREGRLDRLPDELLRLQVAADQADALIAGVQRQCVEGAQTSNGDDDGDVDPTAPNNNVVSLPAYDPDKPFRDFSTGGDTRLDSLVLSADGYVGHDNHTFLLTPALRVTEPGAFQGQAIDLERDDTLGGGHAALTWILPLGERDTILDRDPLRLPAERANVLVLRADGGYEGRLRWGQLAGAEAGGQVVADWFGTHTEAELTRWHLELDGGLEVPGWLEEHDLLVTPVQRAGGRGRLSWTDHAVAPTRERDGIAGLQLSLDAEGWHSVEPTDDAQGVIPPEDWWQLTRGDALWNFAELQTHLWLGLGVTASNRLSEGDFGHGSAGEARLQLTTATDRQWRLTLGAGYGVAVPWGDAAAMTATTGVDGAPGVDMFATRLEREVEHEPVLEARYELRDEVDGDDTLFVVDLTLAHRLALAGRDGWSAATDMFELGFRVLGPLGLRYAELELFAHRAGYDRGLVVVDGVDTPGLDDTSERVVAGFTATMPLYVDAYVSTTLRGEGRLASSTPRFEGRYEGQFRVLLTGEFAWDLLGTEDLDYDGGIGLY